MRDKKVKSTLVQKKIQEKNLTILNNNQFKADTKNLILFVFRWVNILKKELNLGKFNGYLENLKIYFLKNFQRTPTT